MYKIALKPPQDTVTQSVVTIGNFDGVHLGHQQLFLQMQRIAQQQHYRSIVITFEPSPAEYFARQKHLDAPKRLCLLRDKFLILKQLGYIDELVILRFNHDLAQLSPQEFIHNILIRQLNAAHIVIGHDFRFGKNASGNANDLKMAGIACSIAEPHTVEDVIVSSTCIRQLAAQQHLQQIKHYLGRNISYTARIIHGNRVGREFGVATINLSLMHRQLALHGIYIAYVHIDGNSYRAAVSIGTNPSVSKSNSCKLEAHLLDVDLNLYGKIATVEILDFIRDEMKFDHLNDLFAQIHEDIKVVRNFFTKR